MWSKAALTLESLENRSIPGKWVALNRPLAARIAWRRWPDVNGILPSEGRALLTLTIWSRAGDEKYNVFE